MQFTTLRRNSIKVAILCVSLFSTSVFALKDDTSQPLNIISNEQLADFNNNKAIFVGEVVATQGSIEIHAQRAEITRSTFYTHYDDIYDVVNDYQLETIELLVSDDKVLSYIY